VMNFKSSSWDTCAPEALVRAAGGESLPPPSRYR
jgi:3'-phosphoadenosine 5'-phosphosulfate (PAPS) 3'-phosphatase